MSTDAEVAMLMLRLLMDRPQELQKVLDTIQSEVLVRKAILAVGNKQVATRKQIMGEFKRKFGLTVKIPDEEPDETQVDISNSLFTLQSGASFKVG